MNTSESHIYHYEYENGCSKDMTVNGSAMLSEYPSYPLHKRPNPEDFLPVPKLRIGTAAAVVFAMSVLCFCVSYDGDFVYDDKRAIVYNKDLLPETPLSHLLIHDFWGEDLLSETSHKSYRPLTVLSFRLNYYLGGHSPVWYHIPNILLHGVVSVLLLCVFSVLFGGYEVNPDSGDVRFKADKSALLCTLLFAVHPIHTESVSGIVGRADLLCAVLFLVSFLLYVRSCANELQEDDNKLLIYRPSSFSVYRMLGSMLMCLLSVLCKEQGITILGICSAYDLIIICAMDPRQIVNLRITEKLSYPSKGEYEIPEDSDSDSDSDIEKEEFNELSDHEVSQSSIWVSPWVLSLIQRHVFLIVTGLLILIARWLVMGSTAPAFVEYNIPHSYQNGTFIRALNYNYLYSLNAWLLVNPWWLCFDWSMGCVPVIKSFSDARIIGGIAVWIVIATLMITCFKAPVTRDKRVITLGLAFIIVPFLPASNVFFRVGFVLAERNLYLPSIGFCMLVVLGIRQICAAYPRHVQIMKFGICSLFCVFVLRCIQRSSQWRVEVELYKSAEKVCPLNAKIQFYLAMVNSDKGKIDYAIEKYKLGLELHPTYVPALNNLGYILLHRGELDEAELFLKRAIDIKSAELDNGKLHGTSTLYAQALNNLADIYSVRGKLGEAEKLLERAINNKNDFATAWMNLCGIKRKLNKLSETEWCYITAMKYIPDSSKCLNNLGNLYSEVKMIDKAIEAWTNATVVNPSLVSAWLNLAFQLYNYGRYEESIKITVRALKHHPHNAQLYFNLGNVYGKQRNWLESEQHFLRAIELNPTIAQYYANLGTVYFRWKKYRLAELNYKEALSINPNEPNVKENLALLTQT